jgi:hypothetical protein
MLKDGAGTRFGQQEKEEGTMHRISKLLAVLALGLAVSALTTPSFAQRSEGMSGARAQALRTCTKEAGKLIQHVWGDHQIDKYRACMMQHHQEE